MARKRPPDLGLFQHINRNRRRSLLLILLAIGIAGLLGGFIGAAWADSPVEGVGIALVVAALFSWGAWSGGSKLVMAAAGAKEVGPLEDKQLHNVVEEMAIASGLPKPRVYKMDDPAMNAFATGMSPKDGAVAVTSGLRNRLTRDELQGVIAHEMAHIGNFDTRVMVLMATLVGTVAVLSEMFLRSFRVRGVRGGRGKGSAAFLVIAVVLAVLAPFAVMLIKFAVSRQREYLADATGAAMTRNPGALASALEKLAGRDQRLQMRNRGTAHLFIVNPFRMRQAHNTAFATHPPMAERIYRLRALEGRYAHTS